MTARKSSSVDGESVSTWEAIGFEVLRESIGSQFDSFQEAHGELEDQLEAGEPVTVDQLTEWRREFYELQRQVERTAAAIDGMEPYECAVDTIPFRVLNRIE